MGSLLEEMHKMRLKEKNRRIREYGWKSTCRGARTWRGVSL